MLGSLRPKPLASEWGPLGPPSDSSNREAPSGVNVNHELGTISVRGVYSSNASIRQLMRINDMITWHKLNNFLLLLLSEMSQMTAIEDLLPKETVCRVGL